MWDGVNHLANFDHHSNCVREATMSPAQQVYFALKGGLCRAFQTYPEVGVYINDVDQDTALAVWLLRNSHLFEGTASIPHINRLLSLNDRLDITGGAFPMNLDDSLLRQHNWVFALYTEFRKSGALASGSVAQLTTCLEATLARLDKFLLGQGGETPLGGPAILVAQHPTYWVLDEVTGNDGRYRAFSQGMCAFLSRVAQRPDGTTVYTIGRKSQYIDFPLDRLYPALSAQDHADWGGSTLIGGSHRQQGSRLSWEEAQLVIDQVLAEAMDSTPPAPAT
jgi:hypothetical protein